MLRDFWRTSVMPFLEQVKSSHYILLAGTVHINTYIHGIQCQATGGNDEDTELSEVLVVQTEEMGKNRYMHAHTYVHDHKNTCSV